MFVQDQPISLKGTKWTCSILSAAAVVSPGSFDKLDAVPLSTPARPWAKRLQNIKTKVVAPL